MVSASYWVIKKGLNLAIWFYPVSFIFYCTVEVMNLIKNKKMKDSFEHEERLRKSIKLSIRHKFIRNWSSETQISVYV